MPALQKKHKKSSVHNIKSVMTLDMVRVWGLEPQRISAQEPKSCMSANSIIPAYRSN